MMLDGYISSPVQSFTVSGFQRHWNSECDRNHIGYLFVGLQGFRVSEFHYLSELRSNETLERNVLFRSRGARRGFRPIGKRNVLLVLSSAHRDAPPPLPIMLPRLRANILFRFVTRTA